MKQARSHLWMLFLGVAVFCAGLYGLTTGKLAPAACACAIGAFFLSKWWGVRAADGMSAARTPEKRAALLDKIRDPAELYRIARDSEPPLRDEALARITDQKVFLDKARELEPFAVEQLTDQKLLYYAADGPYRSRDERRETKAQYEARCEIVQKAAVDRLTDEDYLQLIARGPGYAAPYEFVHRYAAEKLLREHPEKAEELYRDTSSPRELCAMAEKTIVSRTEELLREHPERAEELVRDESLPETVRALARETMIAEMKKRIREYPETAAAAARDREQPEEIRLAALEAITDPEKLYSCYDPNDAEIVREQIARQLDSQPLLIELAEKEPLRRIREIAERRVTDPEQRLVYCRRGEAHEDEQIDYRWEECGEDRDEVFTYKCRICGRVREEQGDRMRM